MGMLYAAGYGYGVYNPSIAPVPFEDRDKHGIFEYTFSPPESRLALSVNDILNAHPDKDRLLELDKELAVKNNTPSGLTLMTYCVRWNSQASRMLFYFGNHCVVKEREEPRIACLFTCKRDFSDLHMALDMSTSRGVHWSWHPDGEHLIGYGNPEDNDREECCMSVVRYNGEGFRKLCSSYGSGHPSISPVKHNILLTDTYGGKVILWDIEKDRCISDNLFPAISKNAPEVLTGRNEFRVCHHPVFTEDGRHIIFNVLDGLYSKLYEVDISGEIL
jgi:hypothetical protein